MASKWLRAFLEAEEPPASLSVERADSVNSAVRPLMPPTASPIGANGTIGTAKREQKQTQCAADLSALKALTAHAAEHEERAAIIAEGSGAPIEWCQGYAQLDPDRPPGDIPVGRWLRFVDDCGHFLDGGFAEQAAALGWGPLDLFGADADRPFARVDKAGLLWLLHGDRLVALTADAAIIETATGARQTYRRAPSEPGRVLAWELSSRGAA